MYPCCRKKCLYVLEKVLPQSLFSSLENSFVSSWYSSCRMPELLVEWRRSSAADLTETHPAPALLLQEIAPIHLITTLVQSREVKHTLFFAAVRQYMMGYDVSWMVTKCYRKPAFTMHLLKLWKKRMQIQGCHGQGKWEISTLEWLGQKRH